MKLFLRVLLSAVVGVAVVPALSGAAYAAVPSNDTPAGATAIGSLPTTISEDTTAATTDATDSALNADCGAPATNASVWFKYTDPTGAGFVATMGNSDYTGGFMVTEGDPSQGNLVACGPTTVGVRTTAGQTYYVVAFSDTAVNGGHLQVTFDQAPPMPELSVTANPKGVAYKDGSAQVSGTYTCTNADGSNSEIDGTLTQRVGRVKILGYFTVYPLQCDGASHAWSALVTSDNGLFRGGKAASVSFGYACGALDCAEGYAEQTVQLNSRGH
jgi:hypothetical protein